MRFSVLASGCCLLGHSMSEGFDICSAVSLEFCAGRYNVEMRHYTAQHVCALFMGYPKAQTDKTSCIASPSALILVSIIMLRRHLTIDVSGGVVLRVIAYVFAVFPVRREPSYGGPL